MPGAASDKVPGPGVGVNDGPKTALSRRTAASVLPLVRRSLLGEGGWRGGKRKRSRLDVCFRAASSSQGRISAGIGEFHGQIAAFSRYIKRLGQIYDGGNKTRESSFLHNWLAPDGYLTSCRTRRNRRPVVRLRFVVATLSMRTMIPLRVFAILTNIVLISTAIPNRNYLDHRWCRPWCWCSTPIACTRCCSSCAT